MYIHDTKKAPLLCNVSITKTVFGTNQQKSKEKKIDEQKEKNHTSLQNIVWLRLMPNSLDAQRLPGDKIKRRGHHGQNGRNDNQHPIHDPLGLWDLVAKDFEVEGEGQDDADGEASDRAQQTHDAVEFGHQDAEDDKHDGAEHADGGFEDAARQARHAVQGGGAGDGAGVEADEDFKGADDGAGVQGDFGQGDDGDADDDDDGQPLGVSLVGEDVGGDFVADGVAEHEETDDGHEEIQGCCEGVGDVDAAVVLVGVAHVAVNVWKDAVATPGRHEETETERKGCPVLREEVGFGWLAEGSRGVRLDEAIDDNANDDCTILANVD